MAALMSAGLSGEFDGERAGLVGQLLQHIVGMLDNGMPETEGAVVHEHVRRLGRGRRGSGETAEDQRMTVSTRNDLRITVACSGTSTPCRAGGPSPICAVS